jgi:hypothetical protein
MQQHSPQALQDQSHILRPALRLRLSNARSCVSVVMTSLGSRCGSHRQAGAARHPSKPHAVRTIWPHRAAEFRCSGGSERTRRVALRAGSPRAAFVEWTAGASGRARVFSEGPPNIRRAEGHLEPDQRAQLAAALGTQVSPSASGSAFARMLVGRSFPS